MRRLDQREGQRPATGPTERPPLVARNLRQQGTSLGLGLAAGLVSGVTGVGGGIVLVPLLTGVLKLDQHRAHGTSLAVVAVTATASALAYGSHGYADWRLAAVIAASAMVGGIVGARLCCFVPAHQLRQLFAGLLLLVGGFMVLGLGGGGH